jgi:hypothetical protein
MTDTFDYAPPESLPPPTTRITVSPQSAQPAELDDWVEEAPPQTAPQPVTTPQVQAGPPAAAAPVADAGGEDDWAEPGIGERDIDRSTGAPFALRLEMARSQNPDEAKLVLDKYYGPGNYGQDKRGNWWAMEDGKPVAVFPEGITPQGESRLPSFMKYSPIGAMEAASRVPAIQNMAAHVGAGATPLAGGTLGGSAGAVIGGPLGAAVGAGLGAAGGYGIDQRVKWYRGLYAQKPNEVAKNMRNEALLNTGMTAAAPLISKVGRTAANAFRDWTGVTPTGARMTGELVSAGARPPIKSVAPEFRSWGDKQTLRNIVAGDPWEAANTDYIRGRLAQGLRSSGVPDAEIEELISTAAHPTIAPTRRTAGEMVVAGAQRHVGQLQAEALEARNAATTELRNYERGVRTWAEGAGRDMEGLSEGVAQTLIGHRRAFGQQMGREYRAIDGMTGDERIFNLDAAHAQVRRIVDLAEPGLVPPYIRRMVDRAEAIEQARAAIPRIEQQIARAQALPDAPPELLPGLERQLVEARTQANQNWTTFSEAHELRSNLRELMGHEFDPTRTPWVGKLGRVEDAIDDTFRAMERSGDLPGQAATRLRSADAAYREGIQIFKDAQLNKLIRDIKSGVGVDPEKVASTILQMGHTASGRRLLNMLSPELRENVARADMRNILEEASRRNATGAREIDGMAFLDALENRKRAGLMNELHHVDVIRDLNNMGRMLAALDGKISLDAIPPGGVADAVRTAINRVNQIDAFVRGNPVGAMVQGTPQQVDRAARTLALPGNEAQTVEAARFFGPDSPEWQAVQRHALQNLIRGALVETPAARMTVSGPAIERVLKKYTDRQQELLFPNGLADDLREVAKQAKFLFPNEGSDMAQSMAAKSITLHTGVNVINPRTAYADMRYLYTTTMGWLTDRPAVLRFLADTAKKNPSEARALLGYIGRAAMNAQMMGPGRGKPTQQGQQ